MESIIELNNEQRLWILAYMYECAAIFARLKRYQAVKDLQVDIARLEAKLMVQ